MKIGFDAKRAFHNTTGLGNYSRDLISILSRYYPDNQYHLYNPKKAKVNRLAIAGNMHVHLPKGFFEKLLPSFWRSKSIQKNLKKDQIDIFHGLSGELPIGMGKIGIKSVVSIHDLIFIRYPELYKPIDRKIYIKKNLKAAKTADKIVAISEQTKKDIIKFLNVEPEKIEVIYQGCHQAFKKNYSSELKDEIRNKYTLPEHFLLNVGTIEPRKNALTIVKAIHRSDYKLVLIGKQTAYAEKIKKFIKKNKMETQVFILEGLDVTELAIVYQLADIFIYPSIFEGFGIPIIEALFSKTPVISNGNGVFPEAGGDFSSYISNALDAKELREKIDKLSATDKAENIQKSFEFAQKFNDQTIAEKWIKLYESL